MPIANCLISPRVAEKIDAAETIVDLWSDYSGQSKEHMTLNLISSLAQAGAQFDAMAFLYLPSLWSEEAVSKLQIGLAKSLSEYFSVPLESVQVVTYIVNSGRVIEDGKQVEW